MEIGNLVRVIGTENDVLNEFTGEVVEIKDDNINVKLDLVPPGYVFPELSGDEEQGTQWFHRNYLEIIS
jgi:hypothetical protein